MEYKNTLNLPETKFSMRANLNKIEINILDFWNYVNIYNVQNKKKNNKFILIDGPPYSNGNIHMGHAFNKILKDIICRFKILDGFSVDFIPGWDCHGLPIEINVEKNIKFLNKDINDKDFRLLCKDYANDQINLQKNSFIRLGINASWSNFYKTMDFSFEASIVSTFKELINNNFIYNSIRPVYWCFNCMSALADAELEYIDKQSDSIYIFFELYNFSKYFDKFYFTKIGFIVWTTTPWTLPFNEAIALNPKSEYILIAYKEIGYIFDKNLLNFIIDKFQFFHYDILYVFKADFFLNLQVIHPIYDKRVTIVLSDHVTNDSGTGCVHIAPAYGYDDYKVALKYKLQIKNSVDANGYFYGDVEKFSNINIKDVNKLILSNLIEKNNLIFNEILIHRYPHCWRHKTPLIFRTTNQWFLNIDNNYLRERIINISNNDIKWIPQTGKKKIMSMIIDRPDWCLSRQRLWGVPIFLFINKNDNSFHPETSFILEKIIDIIKIKGSHFWYNDDVFKMFNINKDLYFKIDDVLDVWYDSGSVYKHILDKHSNNKLPFDLCLEGNDQYRGWFQSSLINSIANFNISPYKFIIAHGFVLDGSGRKMSKSLNNIISPDDILNSYGADILRLWTSSVNYCFDVNISNEILDRICESYRKIRNTFRFILSNIYDLSLENNSLQNLSFLKIDLWLKDEFIIFKNDILNDFNNYKFYSIYKKIHNFCIDILGSKYFEIVKDRLYLMHRDSIFRLSCQAILYYILYNFVKLISPILSFTSEEIWNNLKIVESESIFFSEFDFNIQANKEMYYFNIKDFLFFDKVFYIKNILNKLIENYRIKFNIGSSLELTVNIYCNIYWFNLLYEYRDDLHLFFLVSNVKLFLSFNLLTSINFEIFKSLYSKCERCWHRNLEIISNKSLKICPRCIYSIYYYDFLRKLC